MMRRMFSVSFSFSNFAECTPMTTNSFGYFFSSFFRSGMMCMQLMQPYVQKSSNTTLPLSAASDSGLSVFSQPRSPVNSGARVFAPSYTAISRPFDETDGRSAEDINHRGHRERQINKTKFI